MKSAILNDTHFGARNDNAVIAEHQRKFYDEVFFPYLKENNIDTIFHLGDLTDRRKYINFVTAQTMHDVLFKRCQEDGIKMYIIAGNHEFNESTNTHGSL